MSDEESYGVPFKVTLKAGTGYNAPWLVIEADTAGELIGRLAELKTVDAYLLIRQYALDFEGKSIKISEPAPADTKASPPSPSSTPESTPPSDSVEKGAGSDGVMATTADQIVAALEAATTLEQLREVHPKFKAQWNDQYTQLALARKAALEA